MTKITKFDYSVLSLDFKNDNYIVGTKGAEIYEFRNG